jgi:hypothetical protein
MKTAIRGIQSWAKHQVLLSGSHGIQGAGHCCPVVSLLPDTYVPEEEPGWLAGIALAAKQFDEQIEQATRLAWCAGFLDGDGCLTAVIQRHRNRATPSVRIRLMATQNDHYVLKVLKDVLGERGHLNPVKRQASHNRQCYQLQYDSGHAVAAIKKILPYLIRKRREADLCLELFVKGRLNINPGPKGFPPEIHQIRKALVKRIKKLK